MIKRIANSGVCQKLIKKTKDPKFLEKFNRRLPLTESSFATLCYMGAIQVNDSIPKERKPSMQYQNAICGATGVLVSGKIDKLITGGKEKICKELNGKNIPKINNIVRGVRVLVPLVIVSFFLRFFMPTIAVPISTAINKMKKVNNS